MYPLQNCLPQERVNLHELGDSFLLINHEGSCQFQPVIQRKGVQELRTACTAGDCRRGDNASLIPRIPRLEQVWVPSSYPEDHQHILKTISTQVRYRPKSTQVRYMPKSTQVRYMPKSTQVKYMPKNS